MRERSSIADADLIRSAQDGSQAAMETLYERYLPSVWRYVCTQVRGDQHVAEDVVSETFLAAVRGIGKIRPDSHPLCAWLTGIAKHKLADHWRRARLSVTASSPEAEREKRSSRPAGPQDALAADEQSTRVAAAMAALDDEERVALEWKYLENLSVREIAERLGRTEKAAEALLYRARNSFRAVFEALQGRHTGGEQERDADDR